MSYKNMSGDNEEVYVFVDEDGNEVIVDENLNEVGGVDEYMAEEEITMDEEYELEDAFEDEEEDDGAEYDGGDGVLGNVANKMLVVFGVMIALIAIGIGIFFLSRKGGGAADFSKVGKEFAQIGVVGGSKIEEITSVKGAQLDALYQAQEGYNYDEADTEEGITNVSITLTSILKDLKVKFVNSKGKLIANVPFEVEVTGPDGKSTKWTDTDKDGIIYQTELSGGAYSVKVIPLSGYETMYDFSKAEKQSCSVKTQLDYQKVDVKNEIKSASKVAATEDVSKKETAEEGQNKDTVAFVESAKKASSSGYTPIEKGSIKNPIDILAKSYEAGLSRFKRLSGPVNTTDNSTVSPNDPTNPDNPDPGQGGGGQNTPTEPTYTPPTSKNSDGFYYHTVHNPDGTTTEEKCDNQPGGTCTKCGHASEAAAPETETKYVERDGKYYKQVVIKGTTNVQSETEVSPTYEHISGTNKHKVILEGTTFKEEDCVDADKDGKCDRCLTNIPVTVSTFTLTADKTAVAKGGKAVVTAATAITPAVTATASYSWSSTGTGVTISQEGTKATFTFANAGKYTVKCVVEYKNTSGTVIATLDKTIEINVTDNLALSLDRTAKKAIFVGGDLNGSNFKLTATVSGGAKDQTVKVAWSTNDALIDISESTKEAKFNQDGKATFTCVVKGKSKGDTTVTVALVGADGKATSTAQSINIRVEDPRHDTSTKLTDGNGNPVFVFDKSSNTYKEATYANYFTGENLYTAVAVTYIYTGWWQLDGKTYYFDANGNKVTGDQVICGAKYSFGSDGALKSGTGTFGIDVSKWNGTIDWNRVAKSGVSYAIIRCGFRGTTVGGLVADDKFKANVTNAQAAGIKVGVYFYSQAVTEAEAVEEASTCLTLIDTYKVKPTYPIFIDIESAGAGSRTANMNKSQRTAVAKAFCKTISNSGYKAGVYSNKTWLTNNIDTASLTGYTIWLAQYAQSPTYTATRYDIWQYSDKGTVGGISGNVDLDLSYMGY